MEKTLGKLEEHEEKHKETREKAEEAKEEAEKIKKRRKERVHDYLDNIEPGTQIKLKKLSRKLQVPRKQLGKYLKKEKKKRKDLQIKGTGLIAKIKRKEPVLIKRKPPEECPLCGKEVRPEKMYKHVKKKHKKFKKIIKTVKKLPVNKELNLSKTAKDMDMDKNKLVKFLKVYMKENPGKLKLLNNDFEQDSKNPDYFIKKKK